MAITVSSHDGAISALYTAANAGGSKATNRETYERFLILEAVVNNAKHPSMSAHPALKNTITTTLRNSY